MRINLKVPFTQKEAAKELGARWDGARKIWYVIDPECLEVFSDWMPEQESGTGAAKPLASAKAQSSPGVLTGPKLFKPLCTCAVLPWEPCPHAAAAEA
jgi:hypothetical protein